MKLTNLLTLCTPVLFAVGCSSTYPEHRTSYNSYDSMPGSTVISSPAVTAPYTPSPSVSSGVSQGAAAASQVLSDTDQALVNTVRQTLYSTPSVANVSRGIYLTARNGTVTLTGTVPSEQDRQFIDNAVRNTSGVYSVNDQLQIVAQPTGTAAEPRVYSTAPVTENGSQWSGNIFNLHVQGLNEPDRTLAQRILHELRGDTILPSLLPMVNITVAEGRVTLQGNVQNDEQRRIIESAIQRAAGPSNVSDQLQVISR